MEEAEGGEMGKDKKKTREQKQKEEEMVEEKGRAS